MDITCQLQGKHNNFNLIRLIAAYLVLVSHSFPLATGDGTSEPLKKFIGISFGHISVDVFFITSGFLITASLMRSKSTSHYITSRVLRIFPALILSVLGTVFIMGPLVTKVPLSEYFSQQTFEYIYYNSTLLFGVKFELPGVFYNLPWKSAVNGSLWTLPHELKMYIYILLIFVLTQKLHQLLGKKLNFIKFKYFILTISVLSVLLHLANHAYFEKHDDSIRLFSFFFIGSAFYCFAKNIKLKKKYFLLSLIGLAGSTYSSDFFVFSYIILLPYTLFYIAFVPAGAIRKFNLIGDYSYGIYIYAFPFQQLTMLFFPSSSVTQLIFISTIPTLILAYISWNTVEKNSLKLKNIILINRREKRV